MRATYHPRPQRFGQVLDGVRIDLDGVVFDASARTQRDQRGVDLTQAGADVDDAQGVPVRKVGSQESGPRPGPLGELVEALDVGSIFPVRVVVALELLVGRQRVHRDQAAAATADEGLPGEPGSAASVRPERGKLDRGAARAPKRGVHQHRFRPGLYSRWIRWNLDSRPLRDAGGHGVVAGVVPAPACLGGSAGGSRSAFSVERRRLAGT